MRKKFLLIPFIFISLFSMAQTRTVTGKVSGKDDGQPLIGVNVVSAGTQNGTVTDIDGKYSIDLSAGENSLVFSYVGFESDTVNVSNTTTADVVMSSESKMLNDVVVVGYGTQKKSDLTGSVSTVKTGDITKVPSFDAEQALQGKVAGVEVTSTSGAPGALPVIRVRGTGTFNNASPIFVVDGVILNDISFLSPSDIQTIEVLKDASATAIYGNRGANGVILITTKHGKAGQTKPTITIGAEYSIQQIAHQIPLLTGSQFANYVDQFMPGAYNNIDDVANTNWQSLIFHTAPIQNYEASASGATDKSTYYVGLSYFNQQGIIDKSNYQRFTLKFNNTFALSKNLSIGNNITFAPFTQQNTADATYAAYRAQPVDSPFLANGDYGPVPGVGNPLAAINYTNDYARGLRLVGNIYGDVTFLDGFDFHSSFDVDLGYGESRDFTPVYLVSPEQQNPISMLSVGNSEDVTWIWENTLNYKRTFGKNSIDALAGYTMQDASSEALGATGQNIISDNQNLWYLNPDNLVPTSIYDNVDPDLNFSQISYLARLNYTYDEKYLLTATFRRDGSSKFQGANEYGNFPSFALGWNIVNENFMKRFTFLSDLKLRASWGIIGNDKISYLDQYALVQNQLDPVFGLNQTLTPGSSYGITGNPNLQWESTKQYDGGLEIGFLNDKLTGEFDYYNRETDDILVELSTPGYFGNGEGAEVDYNAGSVLNRGFEFNVNWSDNIHKFHYSVGVLGSTLHNEVLSVGGNSGVDTSLIGGNIGNGSAVTLSKVGEPIGSFYGYKVIGVFQTQSELDSYPHDPSSGVGDLKFEDVNGDGVINSLDRVNLGSPIPTFIFGFNADVSYDNFSLSLDFQGQTGNVIYNAKQEVRPDLYNYEAQVLNFWHGEGTSNTEPRPSAGGVNYDPSSYFIQDGSFLRLRSANLSYTLPKKIASKLQMTQATVYVSGTNLWTLTKFTGYSPEVSSEDVLSNGIDEGGYPVTSVYSVGINLTF
jgi:TonB-linked SusC/RagA family outer membrane protein